MALISLVQVTIALTLHHGDTGPSPRDLLSMTTIMALQEEAGRHFVAAEAAINEDEERIRPGAPPKGRDPKARKPPPAV